MSKVPEFLTLEEAFIKLSGLNSNGLMCDKVVLNQVLQKMDSSDITKSIKNISIYHTVCLCDYKESLKYILSFEDIDVCIMDNATDKTALHMGVLRNNSEIIKILLDDGRIDVNLIDNNGYTALEMAYAIKNTGSSIDKIIKLLNY